MKNQYLQELLKENKTVIIPKLGAFVVNDSKTMPFVYNEYLKFDDGLVVSYVAEKENISRDDAGKKLEVFVSGIISLLESGRDVVFTGIGKLNKGSDGKMHFTCDTEAKDDQASHPPPPVIPVAEEKKPEPPKEKTPEIIPVTKPEEKKPEPKAETPKEKTVLPENGPKAVVKDNDAEAKKAPAKEEKSKKAKEEKKKKPPKEKNPKKKKRLILIVILIALLGGGGTAGYLYKDKIMTLFGSESVAEHHENESNQKEHHEKKDDTPLTNETGDNVENTATGEGEHTEAVSEKTDEHTAEPVAETKKPEKEVKQKPIVAHHETSSATSGTHYVIIGAFSHQGNADIMISRAGEQGVSAENIGSYGGLYFVSAYSSSAMSEATHWAHDHRSSFPRAWIFSKQ